MTLEEHLKTYINKRRPKLALRTSEAEDRYLSLYIAPVCGGIALSALNAEHIKSVIESIINAGHTRTAEAVYVFLRAAGKSSAPLRRAVACVARPVHLPKQIMYWEQDDAIKFLKYCSPQWRLCWMLMLCCGLRRGEAAGLRWCDIDTNHMTLHIRNQRIALKGRVYDSPPKRCKQRILPISDELASALSSALMVHDAQSMCGNACDYVITVDGINPINPASINHALYRDISVAGVPRISAHGLRHTFATLCVANNSSIRIIQDVLGHSSVTTTARTYAHVIDNPRRNMMSNISASIVF